MRFVAYLEQKEIENYILQIIKYRKIIIFFYIILYIKIKLLVIKFHVFHNIFIFKSFKIFQ